MNVTTFKKYFVKTLSCLQFYLKKNETSKLELPLRLQKIGYFTRQEQQPSEGSGATVKGGRHAPHAGWASTDTRPGVGGAQPAAEITCSRRDDAAPPQFTFDWEIRGSAWGSERVIEVFPPCI